MVAGRVRQIGAHRVLRKLGTGGMAETFAAVRRLADHVEQPVCIKRVLPAYAEDADYVALFRREASIAAKLRHPGVVALLDVEDDEDGAPFLVLELVDGIDLRALLVTAPHRKLDPGVVAFVAMELAYALDYAHSPEADRPAIVHRDVSPSNILLSRGGDVKLADFGLAKAIHGADATQSGTVRGKIPYLAPETMRGESVDGRADLFSLGVVLFECLAGVRPFDGAHEVDTMTRVLANRREPLLSLAPNVPPALAAIVEHLLEHDRDARPANARAVVDALDALSPPIVARRRLLDLVESRLGGPESRLHVRAGRPDEADRPDVVSGSGSHADGATRPVRRSTPPPVPNTPRPSEHPALEVTKTEVARATRPRQSVARWASLAAFVSVALLATALTTARTGRGHPNPPPTPQVAADAPPQAGESAADRTPPATSNVSNASPVVDAQTEAIPSQPESLPLADAPVEVDGTTAEVASRPRNVATARIRVVVSPWGLTWVDGRPLGRAPVSLELTPGSHRIAAGQESPLVERRIVVARGDRRTVSIDLESQRN